jgi:predicted NUDIX family NTP pyrophosphohydrolase
MAFEKMSPIEAKHVGCLCCGGNHETFPMDGKIAVGFGDAFLEKNGAPVWSERDLGDSASWDDFLSGEQAEEMAAKEPDADWRIKIIGPLKEGEWQRQGEKHWVLYREGMGFA